MGYSKSRELRAANNLTKRQAKDETLRPRGSKKGSKKRKHGRQSF
jgi:hypothetical protein